MVADQIQACIDWLSLVPWKYFCTFCPSYFQICFYFLAWKCFSRWACQTPTLTHQSLLSLSLLLVHLFGWAELFRSPLHAQRRRTGFSFSRQTLCHLSSRQSWACTLYRHGNFNFWTSVSWDHLKLYLSLNIMGEKVNQRSAWLFIYLFVYIYLFVCLFVLLLILQG